MNKGQLIDNIAESADISKAAAGRALDAFIDTVTNALVEGDNVSLIGFGAFSVKDRKLYLHWLILQLYHQLENQQLRR